MRSFFKFVISAAMFLLMCLIAGSVLKDIGGYTTTADTLIGIGTLGLVILLFSAFFLAD